MTASLPPQRKKILSILWCNQETLHNIYIYNRLLAVITFYYKVQQQVSSRPITHFLPSYLGNIVVRYLIYIPLVLCFFHHYMRLSYPRGFLFSISEDTQHLEQLSAAIKSHTKQTLGFSIRHHQWRHIAIALDQHLLQGISY